MEMDLIFSTLIFVGIVYMIGALHSESIKVSEALQDPAIVKQEY